jgi:hypothetical protein
MKDARFARKSENLGYARYITHHLCCDRAAFDGVGCGVASSHRLDEAASPMRAAAALRMVAD